MARKKNLERAIILGLILSTGVYGSAWAQDINAIEDSGDNSVNVTENYADNIVYCRW